MSDLEGKLAAAEARPEASQAAVCLKRPEVAEYYADEVHDLLLCVLKQARTSYCQDGTRAAELIDALLAGNELTGEGKKIFERLKIILFRNKNITKSDVSDMEKLGFEVTRNTDNHYHLVFRGDAKYTFALPSTGGDVRGMKNAYSDIDRQLNVCK